MVREQGDLYKPLNFMLSPKMKWHMAYKYDRSFIKFPGTNNLINSLNIWKEQNYQVLGA